MSTGINGRGPVLVSGSDDVSRGVIHHVGGAKAALVRSRIDGDPGAGVHELTEGYGRRGVVFATALGGILRSHDRGVSWTVLPGVRGEESKIVADRSGQQVYVIRSSSSASRVPVLRSRDGGRTWSDAGPVLYRGLRPVFWTRGPIALDPARPTTAYMGLTKVFTPAPLRANGPFGAVYRSRDGGASWRRLSSGLSDVVPTALAVVPHDTDRVYLGTTRGLYCSRNGGRTWTRDLSYPGRTPVRVLTITRGPRWRVAALGDAGLLLSSRGGRQWTKVATGARLIRDVTVSPSGVGFIVSGRRGRNAEGLIRFEPQ